jgi:hypothetical protein
VNGGRPRDPAGQLAKSLARRRAHLLVEEGLSHRQITTQIDVDRSTLQNWLKRPCPTEAEIEQLRAAVAAQGEGGDVVALRVYLSPENIQGLAAQAAARDVSRTRLVDCAVRMYLDVLARLDGERAGPVDVHGFRP